MRRSRKTWSPQAVRQAESHVQQRAFGIQMTPGEALEDGGVVAAGRGGGGGVASADTGESAPRHRGRVDDRHFASEVVSVFFFLLVMFCQYRVSQRVQKTGRTIVVSR